ncbi:hypothetical protein OK351_01395 [Glutamicibacter sp. MNS18]|uniref:hypothetical protein n=1 Tax=Glutamicibacter sp. MNS18 TaxID=2989817 RepID=UPI002235AB89|nr:hypothetical protein [Glutamicibacter sp. MNS18]MCW4464168.1 hypothetical protein [Glutamicibacter sp. MNS18]
MNNELQVLATLEAVRLFCFLIAGAFGITVAHKVISMLVYLVYTKDEPQYDVNSLR